MVSYARAIGSGTVAAEQLGLCSSADGHLTHKREEVVKDAQRFFPNATGGIDANRVEIMREGCASGARSTGLHVGQHLLHRCIGVAAGIDRYDRSGLKNW